MNNYRNSEKGNEKQTITRCRPNRTGRNTTGPLWSVTDDDNRRQKASLVLSSYTVYAGQ